VVSSDVPQRVAWSQRVGAACAAGLLSAVLCAGALSNDFSWDDQDWLTREGRGCASGVGSCFSGSQLKAYRRPVTAVTFELHAALTESRSAFGYHLESLLLRALVTAAGVLLLTALFPLRAALVGAVVWVSHPVLATGTAWLGARPDLLALLGLTTALWCLQEFFTAQRRGWLLASFGALGFAALSKEQALMGALACVALVWARASSARQRVGLAALYLGLALGLGALVFPHAMALVSTGWSPGEAAGVVVATAALYARVLLLPEGSLLHTFLLPTPTVSLVTLTLAASGLFGWWCWRARRDAVLRVGVVWVAATLFPVLNLTPMASMFFAAYRGTLAVGGVALCVAALWASASELPRRALLAVGVGFALLAAMTVLEVGEWATADLASVAALEATPENLYDRKLLVERLDARGQKREALELLDEGLALFLGQTPATPQALAALSPAELKSRALKTYKPSLAASMRIELATLLIEKGSLHDDLQQYAEAEDAFRAAMSLQEHALVRRRLEALEAARREGRVPPPAEVR